MTSTWPAFSVPLPLLSEGTDHWNGKIVALFPPAEEAGDGARGMVADNLADIIPPVVAECQESDSPREPEFEITDYFPSTVNNDEVTDRVSAAFAANFGDRFSTMTPQSASEDFSEIPDALGIRYTFWDLGGTDEEHYRKAMEAGRVSEDIPVNHSPFFAPVIQPTLDPGTQALIVAAMSWLSN
jgi:hippurate hydrolase